MANTTTTMDCGHGVYNTNTAECDCDAGWSTDPNQDALTGGIEYCGLQGSTIGPNATTPASTSTTSTTTTIIIAVCCGVAVLLVALVVLCVCCRRRRHARRRAEKAADERARSETLAAMLAATSRNGGGGGSQHTSAAEETANAVAQVLQASGLLPSAGAGRSLPARPSLALPPPYCVPTELLRDPQMRAQLAHRDAFSQYAPGAYSGDVEMPLSHMSRRRAQVCAWDASRPVSGGGWDAVPPHAYEQTRAHEVAHEPYGYDGDSVGTREYAEYVEYDDGVWVPTYDGGNDDVYYADDEYADLAHDVAELPWHGGADDDLQAYTPRRHSDGSTCEPFTPYTSTVAGGDAHRAELAPTHHGGHACHARTSDATATSTLGLTASVAEACAHDADSSSSSVFVVSTRLA